MSMLPVSLSGLVPCMEGWTFAKYHDFPPCDQLKFSEDFDANSH